MNIEVEIKVKVDSLDEIRKKVEKIGKLVKAIRQVDEYYVPCQRDFFANKPHPIEWLRIRTNPDKSIFEYDLSINKKENGEQDSCEEYETEVSSPDELRKILKFLDFKSVITVDKHREYWQCGDIEVALDHIEGLGDFIEAEANGDFSDVVEAKKVCIEFLENLGIKDVREKKIHKGYPAMLLEKMGKM